MLALRRPESNNHYALTPRGVGSPLDKALVRHVHGCLYPFHSQEWEPTHESSFASRKLRCYARGSFTTSTNDRWGWVRATPTLATDIAALDIGTPGAVAGDSFGGTILTVGANSPYSSSDFTAPNVLGRVNVCGIRVRNITTMLNRGGSLYALKSPADVPFTSANGTFNQILSNLEVSGHSRRCDTSGSKWSYLYWSTRDSDQNEYRSDSRPIGPNGGTVSLNLAFIAEAPPGAPQTYEIEYLCWGEVIPCAQTNNSTQGLTRNQHHPLTSAAHPIIAELHNRVQITENEPNSQVASFVVSCLKAGEETADIVARATDLADRIVSGAPRVMATASRVLGSFL